MLFMCKNVILDIKKYDLFYNKFKLFCFSNGLTDKREAIIMVDAISGDEPIGKIREPIPVSRIEAEEEEGVGPKVDSGLSSIEKSKAVKPEMIPPMNAPILAAPSNMESVAFAVASLDASGRPMAETVTSFVLKGEEIKNKMLKGWMENLREIEEYVRQLLSSPVYQQLEEIRRKGDPHSGVVSGVQGVTAANAAAQSEPVAFLSALDRLQAMERVPTTAEVTDSSAPQDSSRVLVLPLTAALLAGGLVVGTEIVNAASHPLGGAFELIERLQPIFPQVSIQDLIPVINLMVVAPIYFNSWNEAVSNIRSRERHSYVQTAQNFAKDVIKIVTDPHFVKETLIKRMKGTDQLSPENQERLTRMLKVVLIGISLSLLYSVEVGKVHTGQSGTGKFGGIEPEELRDLLLGKFTKDLDPNKKLTLQEELTLSLIKRAQEQLEPLSIEDRTKAADMLLDYITKPRDLDPMLDPAKVFDETLSSSTFTIKDKLPLDA